MQDAMQCALAIQFAFFLADIFQVVQARPKVFRTQNLKLPEHRGSPLLVRQHATAPAVLKKIGPHLAVKETANRPRETLIGVERGSESQTAHGSGSRRFGALGLTGKLQIALQSGAEFGADGGCFL